MMGLLYYEVTASGRRVALCVDKHDADMVASHWYDGQVRELPNVLIMTQPYPIETGTTWTWTWPNISPTVEPKRKEDTQS